MSCRHDLAISTCSRCYPKTGTVNPGPEEDYEPNLEGPGAVTLEEYQKQQAALDSVRSGAIMLGSGDVPRGGAIMVGQESCDSTSPKVRSGTHHLKSWPRFFERVRTGKKHYELRRDDRQFREGDVIVLHEWDPELGTPREADGYTGRTCQGTILCVTTAAELRFFIAGWPADMVILDVRWK